MMNHNSLLVILSGGLVVLGASATQTTRAATLWTGPMITYSQPSPDPTQAANQDRITARVWLTRAASEGLFNAVTETHYDKPADTDPTDTEWSYGDLADYASLDYTSWVNMSGHNPPSMIGQPAVLHLITDDIYIAITFTNWGGSAGGFAYQRSTPAVAVVPSVSIASPTDGMGYAAPASVALTANASATGGTVTNVEYFAGATSLGSATNSPFSVTGNFPNPGPYALTAVATAGGVTATSAVVNITVVTPVPVTISGLSNHNGVLTFKYSANSGLRYVVQQSPDLVSWTTVVTNVPSTSLVSFSSILANVSARYFRVARLPNP